MLTSPPKQRGCEHENDLSSSSMFCPDADANYAWPFQALGLGQYEVVFRRRDVDGSRMMEVDEGELASLGVDHRMHRASILRMRDELA